MLAQFARSQSGVEEPISFSVSGKEIRGVRARPHHAAHAVGVLFLHGLGGLRSGPHGLLTQLSRDVLAQGYCSLRFDFSSRGESDSGKEDLTTLPDMAEEALAAYKFLLTTLKLDAVVVVGLCSGGNIGIGILDRMPACRGLFLLSVYPFSDGDSFRRDAQRTAHFVAVYWRKLWQAQTWQKLMGGQIGWSGIARTLFGHLRRTSDDGITEAGEQDPRANLSGYRGLVMMVYGDADPDFTASFDYYQTYAEKAGIPLRFSCIKGANHNFYSCAWKQQISDQLVSMIKGICQQG